MNELALFAGAGGGLLAGKLLGWRTVCYVEWNRYAVDVIRARIKDGYLDDAPIWDDCFSFDGTPWAGLVDVISAGFPCQPFSQAGKGLSENDPRNGWPAVKRIISEVRPSFAFLENVPGLISKPYIRRIFGDLAEIGYDAEWGTLSAASVGAPHLRERLWIIAYSQSSARNVSISTGQQEKELYPDGVGKIQSLADAIGERCATRWPKCQGNEGRISFVCNGNESSNANCQRCRQQLSSTFAAEPGQSPRVSTPLRRESWWAVEPQLGRVANGVAHRVDRLEAAGNGQVPEVARSAWRALKARITSAPADEKSTRR